MKSKAFLLRIEDCMLDIGIEESVYSDVPTYDQLRAFIHDNADEYEITHEEYKEFIRTEWYIKPLTDETEYFIFGRWVDYYGE